MGLFIEIDKFANNSGLIINFTKTKLVWEANLKTLKRCFSSLEMETDPGQYNF